MGRQHINNVMNLKRVTLKNQISGYMVKIVLTVEFAGLIGFQPLTVLEMFDKEHASLGVGSHGIQWNLCYFWFRIFK